MSDQRPLGTVLITGAASGLGAAVADAVADQGGIPLVLDLDVSRVTRYEAFHCDVADTRATERLVAELARSHGGLNAVVTAAGIDRPAPLDALDGQAWDRIVAVNLLGTAAVVRAALPSLKACHGRAMIVASSLALRGVADATAYCASKFGVTGFARALAAETKGQMGVTTVFPAGMRTRFFEGREDRYRPADDAQLLDPADVAAAMVFALGRPQGVEMRELVIGPEEEPSWP